MRPFLLISLLLAYYWFIAFVCMVYQIATEKQSEPQKTVQQSIPESDTKYNQQQALINLLNQIHDVMSEGNEAIEECVGEMKQGNRAESYNALLDARVGYKKALKFFKSLDKDKQMDGDLRDLVYGRHGIVDAHIESLHSMLDYIDKTEEFLGSNDPWDGLSLSLNHEPADALNRASMSIVRARRYVDEHPFAEK
jgi:hypothetical protein